MDRDAIVGVVERGNSATLVAVGTDGEVLDRRRMDLTEPGTPTHPHHHEGSWAVGRYLGTKWARPISLPDAVALVERVRAAALVGAHAGLAALAASAPSVRRIAIRRCPPLPETTEERIADNRAQTFADSVMHRQALAEAAEARGWTVHWYDELFRDEEVLAAMGRKVGPPWRAEHKLAAAAALAVLNPR